MSLFFTALLFLVGAVVGAPSFPATCPTETTNSQTETNVTDQLKVFEHNNYGPIDLSCLYEFTEETDVYTAADSWLQGVTSDVVDTCDSNNDLPAASGDEPPYFKYCKYEGVITPSGLGTLKGPSQGENFVHSWADQVHEVLVSDEEVEYQRNEFYSVTNLAHAVFERSSDPVLRFSKPCACPSADAPLVTTAFDGSFNTDAHNLECTSGGILIGNIKISDYNTVGHHRWSFRNVDTAYGFHKHRYVAGMDVVATMTTVDTHSQDYTVVQDLTVKQVDVTSSDAFFVGGSMKKTTGNNWEFHSRVLVPDKNEAQEVVVQSCIYLSHSTRPSRYATMVGDSCFKWGFTLYKNTENEVIEITPRIITWNSVPDHDAMCDIRTPYPSVAPTKFPSMAPTINPFLRRLLGKRTPQVACHCPHYEACAEAGSPATVQQISSAAPTGFPTRVPTVA